VFEGQHVNIIRCYGITQDPNTKDYIMVMEYAEHGNLKNYLNKNLNLNWYTKIDILYNIVKGLEEIHKNELIHRDLHAGNIVILSKLPCVTDMGLCKPANYKEIEDKIYGVLSYVAPEILQKQPYTQTSDIYSFGIIMYEVISGLHPYYDMVYNDHLALYICNGGRPRFNIIVPQLILHLIKRCLDANPLNRPTVKEIKEILSRWMNEINYNYQTELIKQINETEEFNSLLDESIPSMEFSKATYASRILDYDLPKPVNSDDYYEQYDNISNMKYSGIL